MMKSKYILLLINCLLGTTVIGQTNIYFTNSDIYNVLKGNYDPGDYMPAFPVDDPFSISQALATQINPDSMKATLIELRKFENRNTGSDTLSTTRGIGAARTWVLNKFNQYSSENFERLETGYLQFDQDVCDMTRHKNVVAVLPGSDITDPSSIIIEAHLDSRCADVCDINCLAE